MRKSVAKFIEERDGYAANPDNIFLTDGASPAVQVVHATVLVHCLRPVSSHTHTCPALLSLSLVSIQRILMSLIRDHNDSIMIPIPQVCLSPPSRRPTCLLTRAVVAAQYPLYTGTIALFGGSYGSYYLEETDSWGLNVCLHPGIVSLQQGCDSHDCDGLLRGYRWTP